MPIPRPLTHEVKIPGCAKPVWQVSAMTGPERKQIEEFYNMHKILGDAPVLCYRCRVLLKMQPAPWYEIPGGTAPDGQDKPFEHAVYDKQTTNNTKE